MYSSIFPLTVFKVSLLLLIGALLVTCCYRTEHFDDAWFAEQSYWLVKDGWVRSELFRGMNGWEDRIYVVRRQVKVDKRGENGKRQFSKLFHSNHLGYVQFNQKISAWSF